MKKEEYLRQLKEQLRQFDPSLQKEILEDYKQHFIEGEELGISDEEIIAELGNIDEMIAELNEEGNKRVPVTANYVSEDSYRGIRFDLKMADIKVVASFDDQLHIDTSGNLNENFYRFEQREENGIFVLELITTGARSFFFRQHIKVEAALPSGYELVDIKTGSGDIELIDIHSDQLLCTSGSGDMKLKRVSCSEGSLLSGSGEIGLEESELSKVKIQTGSGEVEIENGAADHLEIKTGSGDVECRADIGQILCRTGSGDIEIETDHDCDILLSSGSGDIEIKIEESEGAEVSYSTSSGDVELSWRGEEILVSKKGIELFEERCSHVGVKTGSGDIMIEIG